MLGVSPETQLKLVHSKQALEHEFTDASPAEISREIEAETRRLLSGARFEDYIPVLAHRFAREHLLDRAA